MILTRYTVTAPQRVCHACKCSWPTKEVRLAIVRVYHTCQYGSILPAHATRTKAQCRATQPISTQPTVWMSWVELSCVRPLAFDSTVLVLTPWVAQWVKRMQRLFPHLAWVQTRQCACTICFFQYLSEIWGLIQVAHQRRFNKLGSTTIKPVHDYNKALIDFLSQPDTIISVENYQRFLSQITQAINLMQVVEFFRSYSFICLYNFVYTLIRFILVHVKRN